VTFANWTGGGEGGGRVSYIRHLYPSEIHSPRSLYTNLTSTTVGVTLTEAGRTRCVAMLLAGDNIVKTNKNVNEKTTDKPPTPPSSLTIPTSNDVWTAAFADETTMSSSLRDASSTSEAQVRIAGLFADGARYGIWCTARDQNGLLSSDLAVAESYLEVVTPRLPAPSLPSMPTLRDKLYLNETRKTNSLILLDTNGTKLCLSCV
jgi:hypothetical protein